MDLCKYKNIFGEPGQYPHTHIMGIAWVDTLLTLLLAYAVSYIFNIEIVLAILITFLLGIIMHRLFCVRTTVDKLLFP
jgi:hypothetical protein